MLALVLEIYEGKRMNRTEETEKQLIGIIYSVVINSKLEPQIWIPRLLDSNILENIMNKVNLFFSEKEDWDDKIIILPIPFHKYLGLTYFRKAPKRISSRSLMVGITILIEETGYDFFYQNLEHIKRDLEAFTKELKNTNQKAQVFLSQFYYDLNEFLNRYQKIHNFFGEKKTPKETGRQCVLLSHFNSKMGPTPFFCYPENSLTENDQHQFSKELELNSNEGFYIKSYTGFNAIHLYFELVSDKARGGVEMCLISLIFDELPSKEMLEVISFRLFDLLDKLNSKPEISFVFSDISSATKKDRKKIKLMSDYLCQWVIEVYQSCIENYFERSSEGEFAKILMNFNRARLLEKLSEGPIEIKEIDKWVFENLGKKIDLMGLLSPLINSNLITIKEIAGQETIILLKGLDAYRIPPIRTIERLKSFSSIYPDIYPDLEKRYIKEISKFFQGYKKTIYERVLLAGIIYNPVNYLIITQLRKGGIFLKDDFEASLDKKIQIFAPNNLRYLKTNNIITEIDTDREQFILLKTDIKFEITIPNYVILGQKKIKPLPDPLKQTLANFDRTPERIKDIFKRWFS